MALRTCCTAILAGKANGAVRVAGARWARSAGGRTGQPALRTLTTLAPAPDDPLYKPDYPSHLPIPPSTLAALLARLGLPSTPQMHEALLVALTDVSYDVTKLPPSVQGAAADQAATSSTPTPPTPTSNNTLLATLGNSLLGLFASEHLSTTYPNLPTRALQALTSRYVGPSACFAIARDLGLGVADGAYATDGTVPPGAPGGAEAGRARKRSAASAGVPVRWVRAEWEPEVGAGVGEDEGAAAAAGGRGKRRTTWEEVVARSVRSFVGLIYQEKGIAAARQFVHAHFLSRHVDVASLLNFRAPKHVLGVEVRKLLGQAGAPELAGVESRILAESGRHSLSPIFNIGLFLPSGLKLAEGYGSSLRMAEHRAAVNALVAMYTARGELLVRDAAAAAAAAAKGQQQGTQAVGMDLPTSVYSAPPPSSSSSSSASPERAVERMLRVDREREQQFRGNIMLSRAEALVASGVGGDRGGDKLRPTRR